MLGNLTGADGGPSAHTEPTGYAGAPVAKRPRRPGWRDPRLWIGVAIVAVSVVVGSRLFASVDDTVGVWAVSSDVAAGAELGSEDLVVQQVRFADPGQVDRYFSAQAPVPGDLRVRHSVSAGELLPRSAVTQSSDTGLVEVPVAAEPEQVPSSVGPGSVVDVYLADPQSGRDLPRGGAGPVLSEAGVVEAPAMADSFGTSGRRQVVLAVPEQDAERYFAAMATMQAPSLTIVARA
ncbi:hypothetical protein [Nocardioides insulae]|uniref:hypothetical protein n=1 Tax=Nocardioides insulae TaxID=394734 RepID=UPI0006880D11|nr:hypothetical protein [Nocardioides insulae]